MYGSDSTRVEMNKTLSWILLYKIQFETHIIDMIEKSDTKQLKQKSLTNYFLRVKEVD